MWGVGLKKIETFGMTCIQTGRDMLSPYYTLRFPYVALAIRAMGVIWAKWILHTFVIIRCC